MKRLKIAIIVFFVILTSINLAAAADYDTELFNMRVRLYREGEAEVLNFTYGKGQKTHFTDFGSGYKALEYGKDGEKLFERNIYIGFYYTDSGSTYLENITKNLRLPYHEEVQGIKILHYNETWMDFNLNEFCNENGRCETKLGENYANCSSDCGPGSEDGYCSGEKDGICDPDCDADQDPDCAVEKTLGKECNENGECEPDKGENYKYCSEDCPSGSQDGYCDGVEEGICDPDCTIGKDPDCVEEGEGGISLWMYGALAIVVVILLAIIFSRTKVER